MKIIFLDKRKSGATGNIEYSSNVQFYLRSDILKSFIKEYF